MTEPDDTGASPRSRDGELEDIVDELDQRVTDERAEAGLPGMAPILRC